MGTGNQEKAGLSWREGAVIKCSSLGYAFISATLLPGASS